MERHDLYGLPLEQFTQERNALAKELRREGRRDEAAAVAKLRKPSIAAWAVNQLVRTQGRMLTALLEAGDRLQEAQAAVLAGRGNASALRQAAASERAALGALIDRARGLLTVTGHDLTSATLEQVAETLHAAALERDARDEVSRGCLERELRHVGLGNAEGFAAPATAATDSDLAVNREAKAAARRAEQTARRELRQAERKLEAAQVRRDRVTAKLKAAEDALAAAREQLAKAETRHRLTRERLGDLLN